MRSRNSAIAFLVLLCFLASGCSTASLTFHESEIRKIPPSSLPHILSPESISGRIRVEAAGLDGPAEVEGLEGDDTVVAREESSGKLVSLPVTEILEIERIRQLTPGKGSGKPFEDFLVFLIYVPLIPVALVTWPFLRMMGLDAAKNARDEEKALLAYGGMSRDALTAALGSPEEKYTCRSWDGRGQNEVWTYRKDRVLRGGRALYISPESGEVYFTSFLRPDLDRCVPIR